METQKKKPEWLKPNHPPLQGEQAEAATSQNVGVFPQVVRTLVDPPVSGQRFGLVSFMLFDEPRTFSGSSKPIYGYLKIRGNWADESQAKYEAGKIVREIDSKNKIRIAPVGSWLPITNEEAFDKERIDIALKKEEKSIYDESMKEKEAEQRRIKRELREREEELKNGGDLYDNPESIEYYSTQRVSEIRLLEAIENHYRQIETMKESLVTVRKKMIPLEEKYPKYQTQWVDRYNEERRKTGIPDYVPGEEFEKEHVEGMKKVKQEQKFEDLEKVEKKGE